MSEVKFNEGNVVMVSTQQAGTVISVSGRDLMVLLANGDIWVGSDGGAYHPTPENLATALLDVERLENKAVRRVRDDY